MQNENINNKTEYDLYRGIHNKQYENNANNNKNNFGISNLINLKACA